MELSYQAMLTKGHPSEIHVASIIASQRAVDHIASILPEDKTTIWCAAIDPEINEHSYIVPGLGDAGDLAFGEKKGRLFFIKCFLKVNKQGEICVSLPLLL